jgi:HD-like signal output (HDOD) protein
MSRILFVDDDPDVLALLRDMVPDLSEDWVVGFAGGGEEALAVLQSAPFDVVVTDMVMPEMDGAALLEEVRRLYPGIVRVVLSAHAEDRQKLRSVDSAHQYLAKPFDPETLRGTIERACALRRLMGDARLKQVVSRMGSLPSLPSLYLRLQEACRNPDVSTRTVAEIVSKDAAMTAKILQMVNSAFFGLRRRVSSPMHAVQMLGTETVRALALSAHVFFGCDPLRLKLCSMDYQWSHSLAVSTLASEIAQLEGADEQMLDDVRVAGLLHDAGALVFASSLPGAYSEAVNQAKAQKQPLCEAEVERFGVSHAAVGAYLLGLWALPDSIVEAVAFHHAPRECLGRLFSPLTAVHVADALAHELHPSHVVGAPSQVDVAYLEELELAGRLELWRDACEATTRAAVQSRAD